MSIKIVFLLFITYACSHIEEPRKPHAPKEFSRDEIIRSASLLTKIFDMEASTLACVPDTDEASLLLRTLRPRMDVVQDDLEAMLDDPKAVDSLISTCAQECTCQFIDDLLREHLVTLNTVQKKKMNSNKNPAQLKKCTENIRKGFCQSEFYQELNKEKADFSFDEENP